MSSMWSVPSCYKEGTSLELSSVLYGSLWKIDLSRRHRNSDCWSRYQETSNNKLRTLDCAL
jgi:hypothetical protein